VVFKEKVVIEATDYTSLSGDRILFAVNALNKNNFVPDRYRNRKQDFEIRRGFLDEDEFTVHLPNGFVLEALPESKKEETEFGTYERNLEYDSDTNTLAYKRSLLIKKGSYSKDKLYRAFRKKVSGADNVIPFFPTLDRLNYIIAHAKIGDKDYYMDATKEFSNINVFPVRDYNWGGVLVDNPNKNWKHIFNIDPIKSSNRYALNVILDEDGSTNGTYRCALANHSAYQFRDKMKDKDLDSQIELQENEFLGIEIDAYKLKNANTYEGTVSEAFDFVTVDMVSLAGDKMYVYPMLFLRTEENPFKQEIREFQIYSTKQWPKNPIISYL